MAVATFIYLVMKPHFKYLFLLFCGLSFAYSHLSDYNYPIDILCGYLFGIFQDTPSIKRISISKSIFSLALETSRYTFQSYTIKKFFNYNVVALLFRKFILQCKDSITIGAIKNKTLKSTLKYSTHR
jgi:hypothetical protein